MRPILNAIGLFALSAQAFAGTALPPPSSVSSVPTMSEWGMLSLGVAIVAAGLYLINKKR